MQRDDAQQQTSTNLSTKLSHLSKAESKCCIYKVHHNLRKVNDKAYEPEIIAIGPYHRDKNNLIMMEEHKLRYLQLILQRKKESVEKFVSVIAPLEEEARKCYAEPISLSASQFVEMLILDGCFIIDLLRKSIMTYLREQDDPIFQMDWIQNNLQRDLILFENQIPFFVLCELFDLIEAPNQRTRLIYLVLSFFQSMNPGKRPTEDIKYTNGSSQEIKHLLDLIHRDWYLSSNFGEDATRSTRNRLQFIDSATELREANVKFGTNKKGTLSDISFENGTMFLPHLIIEDRTETFLRNMIAYEQYFQDNKLNPLTDYVMLLDRLIDSSRDVEVLSRYKIIDNLLGGEDEVVAKVFNRLTESVSGPRKNFIYGNICYDVNLHCKKKRNKWMAILRHNYLNSPWAILSIVVGIIVIFLTLVQTVCSVLQVVLPLQEKK